VGGENAPPFPVPWQFGVRTPIPVLYPFLFRVLVRYGSLGGDQGVVDDDYGKMFWYRGKNVQGLEEVALGVENANDVRDEKRVHGLHDASIFPFPRKSRDCSCVE
jgi:hypothetical protein